MKLKHVKDNIDYWINCNRDYWKEYLVPYDYEWVVDYSSDFIDHNVTDVWHYISRLLFFK